MEKQLKPFLATDWWVQDDTAHVQIPIWFELLLHKDDSSLCFLTNMLKRCKQWSSSSISPVCSVSPANTAQSPRRHISSVKSQQIKVCVRTRADQWSRKRSSETWRDLSRRTVTGWRNYDCKLETSCWLRWWWCRWWWCFVGGAL